MNRIEDDREDVDEFGILLGDGIGRAMRISITQGIERQRNGPIVTSTNPLLQREGRRCHLSDRGVLI